MSFSPWNGSRRKFLQSTGMLGVAMTTGLSQGQEREPLTPPDKQPPDLKLPNPPEKKCGYAIVGLGELALGEIMPAFRVAQRSRPVALVSGHPDKAKKVAQAYGVDPKNIYDYDNYDKLAENPEVDVIYIVLPNSMHAEFTIRGFKAGKHVLCEKPMAVSVAECEKMIAAGGNAKKQLMIAYRLHYEPFNLKVMEFCAKKTFGEIRTIASSNCQVTKAPNIRLSKALGGGPVGDVGVYCINAARYITREEPIEVSAVATQPKDDPRFREVPQSVSFLLRFPSGVSAHADCSFDAAESRFYRIHCTGGTIELDPAFSYQGLRLFTTAHGQKDEVLLKPLNHFASEMDHFSECVLTDKNCRTPGAEGLADMRVIKAIEEAAENRSVVQIPAKT